MYPLIYLSLGSNVGDRKANLEVALDKLKTNDSVIQKQSSFYETEPVEWLHQPYFLNLACQIKSQLNPQALLKLCQKVEHQMGRTRQQPKGPRNIDIDILFYGQSVIQLPTLKIPHPALHQRNFVLTPLEEIAPNFNDPTTGKSIHQLRFECVDKSSVVVWDDNI
jgi:2-amino-4-hydroxy-6-hydroxymethyldihydropteridine diphosphokinase